MFEKMFLVLILVFNVSFFSPSVFAAEQGKEIFLVSPLVGGLSSDIQYPSPGGSGMNTLSDVGSLNGLHMMYARQNFSIGSMGHFSKLNKSTENGYLFYLTYYFRQDEPVQPMLGFYADYIHVFTREDSDAIAPLNSLDVDTSIWAFHTIVGLSIIRGSQRITPFIGYFNEQVATSIASEGMSSGGQTINGFSSDSSVMLNYLSAGVNLDFTFTHFIRLATKFYWRYKNDAQPLLTARNRLDFFLSPQVGISLKYDYFDDKYEKNIFASIGPTFIF